MNDFDDILKRGIAEIIDESNFSKRLEEGKPLRIKYGVDPTKPDIHLGHMVQLKKLKKLQELGHTIIFLIGDYTTKIGDPSGRNSTRPVLSDEEIKTNAETYFAQISKILDMEKTEVRFNSEWFSKMNFADILKLAGKFTVAQIIERDDFAKRLKEGSDIGLHEILYPLMQAYDSVELKADVEFGGSDQKFNMLAGRALQKKMDQTPQDVVMMDLLVGLDGTNKMSKSLNNYIAITDSPNEMFGKVMSIPDSLILNYFELCTDVELDAIEMMKKEMAEGKNPRDFKVQLAKLIIETYHDAKKASEAEEEFKKVFTDKQLPSEMPEKKIAASEMNIVDLLVELELSTSKSEARRLVEQGGVEVAGSRIQDPTELVQISDGLVIRAGKLKFMKVVK